MAGAVDIDPVGPLFSQGLRQAERIVREGASFTSGTILLQPAKYRISRTCQIVLLIPCCFLKPFAQALGFMVVSCSVMFRGKNGLWGAQFARAPVRETVATSLPLSAGSCNMISRNSHESSAWLRVVP